jgi:hypothetical protein
MTDRHPRPATALLAAALLWLLPATTPAQDPPAPPPPAAQAPADDGASGAQRDGTGKPDAAADAPSPARAPAAGKGSPQRFEPSEKVRPDFDVAFPVDI